MWFKPYLLMFQWYMHFHISTATCQCDCFPAEGMEPLVADGHPTQSGIETKMSAPHSPGKMSPQVHSDLIYQSLAWNYL